MTTPTFHDIEQLSSLLDERLPEAQANRLHARLEQDADLRAAHENLRQARAILRQLPQRRAPRNFTLTRQMTGVRAPTPRLFPAFQWASALTAIFFLFSLALNFPLMNAIPATEAPMLAAAPFAAESIPAATEMPLAAMAPAATAEPGADLRSLAPAPTGSAKMAPPAADEPNSLPAETPISAASPWPKISAALAALSLLLALSAWAMRWRAEQKFRRA
ncbi:MAG: hypothetical protein OHK0031_05620 [Anaerolineales bacterium]